MVRNELHASSQESAGSTPGRRPVRTCVGCKERSPAADLLRVVVLRSDGEPHSSECVVVPDIDHMLPGRGAWLHPDRQCLENAERRRAFGRALRAPGSIDSSAVRAFVEGVAAERPTDTGARRASPVEKNRQQH